MGFNLNPFDGNGGTTPSLGDIASIATGGLIGGQGGSDKFWGTSINQEANPWASPLAKIATAAVISWGVANALLPTGTATTDAVAASHIAPQAAAAGVPEATTITSLPAAAASSAPWYQTPLGVAGLTVGGTAALSGALSKAPPSPIPNDISGQTLSNIQTADATARINNPNLINQYGATTFSDPTTPGGRSTMTQTLSPEQQKIFDSSQNNMLTQSTLAGEGLNSLSGTIGKPFDISSAPATPQTSEQIRQNVIDAMMKRGDVRLNQANEQQNADLIAAGIRPGTEAYRRAQEQQGQNRNDLLSQSELTADSAATNSFNMDSKNRQNEISNLLLQRQTPLNEVNSLISGSQQSNPFAGAGYQAGATVQPTDVNANANMLNQYNMNAYNQQTAQNNQLISGAATLGGAYLSSRK